MNPGDTIYIETNDTEYPGDHCILTAELIRIENRGGCDFCVFDAGDEKCNGLVPVDLVHTTKEEAAEAIRKHFAHEALKARLAYVVSIGNQRDFDTWATAWLGNETE